MSDSFHLTAPPAYFYPELVRAVDELAGVYAGTYSRETVATVVVDSYTRLAPPRPYPGPPTPARPAVSRDRLRAHAIVEGHLMTDRTEVLFVCVHNAGRSQMAAALLDHAHGEVVVRSAGSAPAGTVNPAVVEVMREWGMDLSMEFPKLLTTEAVQASDVVITMGCGDACPIFPGKRYLDWQCDQR